MYLSSSDGLPAHVDAIRALAHELARLHGGELRLVRSADDWTEFIVRLQAAPVTAEAFS